MAAILLAALGFYFEQAILTAGTALVSLAFVMIVTVIVAAAFRVAYHAEVLANHFGEPYGTMILTLGAVTVEVVMLAILMAGTDDPTLARDTVYSAVMIDINGIIGVATMIGGIRHGEQKYNLDASNSYISMLLVAIGISMFIPDFVSPQAWRAYSAFTIVTTVLLYGVFLRIQTVEHRYFFQHDTLQDSTHLRDGANTSVAKHVSWLLFAIIVIGVLSELLSAILTHGMDVIGLPATIPAVLVALISASPEILTAIRAAARDQMQTVINIALGASLATVLLTVPIIEGIALITGAPLEMAITPLQGGMLLLTLLAAMINLHDGESNVLEGAVHFALFATFLALMFVDV